jgi:molybdate-binding protein
MFSGRPMEVVNLVRWEAGLLVAPGNPLHIRKIADLARPGVSLVRRRSTAAAGQLLSRCLARAGVSPEDLRFKGPIAEGHGDVARLVSLGIADAGMAIASSARAFGLDFVPLASERFDLVIPSELMEEARVVRLLDTLSSRGFRRDVEGLGGNIARSSGTRIARTA